MNTKLNIGGTAAAAGWTVLNIQPGPQVDVVGDGVDLARFAAGSVEEIYASHVLEGLGAWGTHLAFLSPGRLRCFGRLEDIPELAGDVTLHELVEHWMREDRRGRAGAAAI